MMHKTNLSHHLVLYSAHYIVLSNQPKGPLVQCTLEWLVAMVHVFVCVVCVLDARCMSGRKDERVAASSVLEGPDIITTVQKTQLIEDCKHALYSAKCCSYAQGFCLIQAASTQV